MEERFRSDYNWPAARPSEGGADNDTAVTVPTEPAAEMLASLQAARVEAPLAAGMADDAALSAAKGHYNLAPLQSTNSSIELVAQALVNTLANDEPRIIARFRQQQAAWALETPGAGGAGDELGENVLKLIRAPRIELLDMPTTLARAGGSSSVRGLEKAL